MDVDDVDRDKRDERIRALQRDGYSIRAMARELGLSRSRVQQILADPTADYDDADDADGRQYALLGVEDFEPQPPFRFIGMDEPDDDLRALNPELARHMHPRILDADNRPGVTMQYVYRATYAEANMDACCVPLVDHLAEMLRQIEAQGWRQENDGYGTLLWVQALSVQ
jgi:hypothetical protein